MRIAIGAMTGTSIDALDLALIHVHGSGLDARPTFVRGWSFPLTGHIAARTRALAIGEPMVASDIVALGLTVAHVHADAIARIRDEVGGTIDLVAIHGQTVFHRPPGTWQLVNPWPIARAAGCPVVFDLRGADVGAGGQGAPITPLADWLYFHDAATSRAIVNLGGFCNITVLPPGRDPVKVIPSIRGFDVCACNQVLDLVARRALGSYYDDDGIAAMTGTPSEPAVDDLRAALTTQHAERRSLGTGDEVGAWVDRWIAEISPNALAASAASAIGAVIGSAAGAGNELVLAGGGVRNAALVRAIGAASGAPPRTTDDLGVPAAYREAAAMAILGVLCADGTPITLPQVTGVSAPAPISGAWILPNGLTA